THGLRRRFRPRVGGGTAAPAEVHGDRTRGKRGPDRERSVRRANRSLVLGAILRSNPGSGYDRGRGDGEPATTGRREYRRPWVFREPERRSLHGSAASPPLGVEVSETLCPMIRLLVKNAEDPAARSRFRPGRP